MTTQLRYIAITVITLVLTTPGFCGELLSEQDKQKIDRFIQIILTDPQNPALYEMVERVAEEDPKQLALYLESYFNGKPLPFHLIRLHFRFRKMTKDQWPAQIEELEKIKTDVEKLEDRNFQKLYDRLTIQSLEQMPDRKDDLAKLYQTQVLPHWKEYAVDGQETLLKAIFQFYFDENDPKTTQLTQTIFNQLLDRFEGRELPFLHLTLISDTPAPFVQKRSLLRLVEERIRDRSLHLQTCWQRLKWELDALRTEELFMTLAEWQKAVKESFQEYLSLLPNFQPNHWLRVEMEPALLSYLSLGVEWNESPKKSEPLPFAVRACLILMKNPDDLELLALEKSLAVSTFSVQEFYILYRLTSEKTLSFRFKLLTHYLELLKEHSFQRRMIHKEKMTLFSTFLADPLLNDEMFNLILELAEKATLKPFEQIQLYSACLEYPFLTEKIAIQVLQRLNALNLLIPAEAIQELFTIHPTFLKGNILTEIAEMVRRLNLAMTQQVEFLSTLLSKPDLPEEAIIWLLQELGKTKSELAIVTIEQFLIEQPPIEEQPIAVTEAAARALVNIGKASVPSLIRILKQNPCFADIAIFDALAEIGEEAVPLLLEAYQQAFAEEEALLRDNEPRKNNVQSSILEILRRIDSPTAKNFLVSVAMPSPRDMLLKDTDSQLCYEALEALVVIDHDLAIELLIQHIESAVYSESHKSGVIRIFAQLDPENLANYLVKKLEAAGSETSRLILEILTDPNSPSAVEVLLSALHGAKENHTRFPIIDALAEIGKRNEITIPILINSLPDPDIDFRKHLISELAWLQGRSFPYLIEALSHSDPLIWKGAKESLYRMGTINASIVSQLNRLSNEIINTEPLKSRLEDILQRLNQSGSF